MRIVAAHQPNYIPWPGYFYKMISCDDFIFADDDVISKPSFTNRNRIKTHNGVVWLTVPCSRVVGETRIKDAVFVNSYWRKKHLGVLKHGYLRAPFFNDYMPRLMEIIMSRVDGICTLNILLIKQIAEWLDIECTFHMSSTMNITGSRVDRIVNAVTQLGGETYLSGTGAANYQTEATFKEANINLVYYDFKPPVYPQLWGEFVPGLSILDLLFNCGPDSRGILDRCGSNDEYRRDHGVSAFGRQNFVQREREKESASHM